MVKMQKKKKIVFSPSGSKKSLGGCLSIFFCILNFLSQKYLMGHVILFSYISIPIPSKIYKMPLILSISPQILAL